MIECDYNCASRFLELYTSMDINEQLNLFVNGILYKLYLVLGNSNTILLIIFLTSLLLTISLLVFFYGLYNIYINLRRIKWKK